MGQPRHCRTTRSPALSYASKGPRHCRTPQKVPGTVVRLRNHIFVAVDASKGPHQWIHATPLATNSSRPGHQPARDPV